jgi:release factor glutamine methyltransferase
MPVDQSRVWTVRELMKSAMEHLQKKGFDDVRLNVELLLAHALGLQRIQIYLNFDRPLTGDELKRFRLVYERRLRNEPVQYIIGSTSFMGLHFDVDPRVLIPRPETETLIEEVMVKCQRYPVDGPIKILEIGTGSGNIAVSIAKFVKHARITTIEISSDALAVAEQNALRHAVESRIKFLHEDLFDRAATFLKSRYDLLVSNPPYIAKDEWDQLHAEVRDFEPSSALTDGKDGLQFYRRIGEILPGILSPFGSVIMEVGFGQAEAVLRELKNAGMIDLHAAKDLQGIPRVISGMWTGREKAFMSLN